MDDQCRIKAIFNYSSSSGPVSVMADIQVVRGLGADLGGAARISFDGFAGGFPMYSFHGCLKGGKGGFGALLRSQKNIGKKTDNFDATRDLNGRRLRVAKKEERLEQWKEKKEKEDKFVEALKGDRPSIASASVVLDRRYVETLVRLKDEKTTVVLEGFKAAERLPREAPKTVKGTKMLDFDED